jgi:hypothetical protein
MLEASGREGRMIMVAHSEQYREAIRLDTPSARDLRELGVQNKNPQAFSLRVNKLRQASIFDITLATLTAG